MADQINNQDWSTVIIGKGTKEKEKGKGPSRTVSKELTDNFDPESSATIKTSDHSLAISLQQARQNSKITQSELDKACNLPAGTTRNYENGSAAYRPNEVYKMARVLKVTLPRPKTKSTKS